MKDRPLLVRFLGEALAIDAVGDGTPIGGAEMPELGGSRIGPYRFAAIWHSAKGDVPVAVIFNTSAHFYDAGGKAITTGSMKAAVEIKETFVGMEIEAPWNSMPRDRIEMVDAKERCENSNLIYLSRAMGCGVTTESGGGLFPERRVSA